ncbi:MAG TPA: hypothetical protein VFR18_22275 [Terriglobia bacterium]|nr:hypothetical protein [Terriglobia bacterium]
MRRFESHSDLESWSGAFVFGGLGRKSIHESIEAWTDERRMAFHDDPQRAAKGANDRAVVPFRYRSRIEEAPRIVELEYRRRSSSGVSGADVFERAVDLGRNGAGWRVGDCRVLPEIAHHTLPRTLASREEDRRDVLQAAVRGGLVLDDHALVPPGITFSPLGPARENEGIALG